MRTLGIILILFTGLLYVAAFILVDYLYDYFLFVTIDVAAIALVILLVFLITFSKLCREED